MQVPNQGSTQVPRPPSAKSMPSGAWVALRGDIETLYDRGCSYKDSEVLAFTALARAIADHEGVTNNLDVLRWAIKGLGNGQRSQLVRTLLGVDETRGLSKKKRWQACAHLSDQYKDWDSFRHGRIRGKNHIEVYLDEVTDQLVSVAKEAGVDWEPLLEPPSPGPEAAPVSLVEEFYPMPDQISARRWDGEAVSWLPVDMPEEVRASIEKGMVDTFKRLLQTASPPSLVIGSLCDEYVDYYPHWNQLN